MTVRIYSHGLLVKRCYFTITHGNCPPIGGYLDLGRALGIDDLDGQDHSRGNFRTLLPFSQSKTGYLRALVKLSSHTMPHKGLNRRVTFGLNGIFYGLGYIVNPVSSLGLVNGLFQGSLTGFKELFGRRVNPQTDAK